MTFYLRPLTAVTLAFAVTTSALADDDAPAETSGSGKSIAISVGTGPRPLDTLTFGLTGLGARVILVNDKKFDPILGFSHTSGGVSNFPESSFGDRFFTRVGTTTGFLGLRGGTAPPEGSGVMAYGVVGGMVTRQAVGNGEPNDVFHVGGWGIGGQGGFGLDGFLAEGLSVGAEIGGIGILYQGGSQFAGETDDKFSGLAMTSYASVQVTVWK